MRSKVVSVQGKKNIQPSQKHYAVGLSLLKFTLKRHLDEYKYRQGANYWSLSITGRPD